MDIRESFEESWPEDEAELESGAEENSELEAADDSDGGEHQPAGDEADGATGEDEKQEAEPSEGEEKEQAAEEESAPVKGAKAPASWSPKNREHWAKLPADVQAQVSKREGEVNKVLQESAVSRKATQQLNQTLAPYREGLIAAGVNDPFQAIGNVMQTESVLRGGSAQQKAEMVASLINQYGVDIGMLDSRLSGQPVKASPNSDLDAMFNERMGPINQFLEQQQYAQQQQAMQSNQEANNSVQQFSESAEFISDVRMDMADLLDMASNRGQVLSLDDAYKKACAINPEVSEIMAKRATQERIMGGNDSVQRKKAAAASITGNQSGPMGGAAGLSIRDQISDAWNTQIG